MRGKKMDIKIVQYPKNYKKIIYLAGRNCYGVTNELTTKIKYSNFIYKIISCNHESLLEHINITILIKDIPRSLMEQLTRHRHASYSIKSTHFVNHKNFQYQDIPELKDNYIKLMQDVNKLYCYYTDILKLPHYIAREILPNSCLTNIIMTANIREYRLIIKQRITKDNVPLMVDLAKILLRNLYLICPECFVDIIEEIGSYELP
jgi:thymidylate synthase (FAD)